MATPRTQANTELEPLVCYCRVAQHHWLSLFKHTRTQTRNESADSHAEIRLGAKKKNSQPSFLPASTVTPKPPSSAKQRVSARLHHIGALLLRPPVRAGLLCELARSPGETLTTSRGMDSTSRHRVFQQWFVTGTTTSTINKSCKPQVSANTTCCGCTDFSREILPIRRGNLVLHVEITHFPLAPEANPLQRVEPTYPPVGAQQRSLSNTGTSE